MSPDELAAIRERDERDLSPDMEKQWGWKLEALQDRRALLAHIDAVTDHPDRLAAVLHEIDGEFCDPFTADHPVAMHNSQAAAVLGELRRNADADDCHNRTHIALDDLRDAIDREVEACRAAGTTGEPCAQCKRFAALSERP